MSSTSGCTWPGPATSPPTRAQRRARRTGAPSTRAGQSGAIAWTIWWTSCPRDMSWRVTGPT
eukprot:2022065-Prorocentrum_lima.AAC.1